MGLWFCFLLPLLKKYLLPVILTKRKPSEAEAGTSVQHQRTLISGIEELKSKRITVIPEVFGNCIRTVKSNAGSNLL